MSKKYIYLTSFLIPLGIMIGCCIYFGVAPFGDSSLLIIDGLHQYMPFFSVLYDKLKGGESLLYSFRAGLGINFLSLFSYYLSSPLNLFILLFKKSQLNMAVSMLIVLKIALSGLTSGIYFTSKSEKPGPVIVMISVAYALNSYMVGYCWNVMWLDAIMIFPIIMMGLERLIEKRDGRLYGLALFYALYCNYYIAFMICIFLILWYLLYSFKSVKQFFLRGITFALYSLLAAGMAAGLLIPAYMGIKQTASGENMTIPTHSFLTGFADLLNQQFEMCCPVTHDNFDGNANLYFGIFTVLVVIIYFFNKEISIIKKIKAFLLIGFFYVSFNETILNFIWHGFHDQYGIPNRFSFLYGFVLLYMVFQVFEHKEAIRNWHAVVSCFAVVGLLVCARQLAEVPLEDSTYGAAGMLLVLYTLILFIMSIDKKRQKWHLLIFCFVGVVEMCATAVLGFDSNGQISISKFFYGTDDVEEAAKDVSDGTFYRSELANSLMVDESTWYPFNSVGLFGSTATDPMVNIMDSLGFYTGCNEYLYKGATPVTNMLLNVKYLYYHAEDSLNTDFTYKNTYGSFDVYENETKGMSIGYMIDDSIDNWIYDSVYPFRVLNDLSYQGYSIDNVFENIEITDPVTNLCTASRTNDGEYYFEYEDSAANNMVYTINAEEDFENLYLFYDGTQVNNAEISIDGQIVKNGDLDGYICPIGAVSAGSVVTVAFELKGETPDGYVRLSAADFNKVQYDQLVTSMTGQAFSLEKMSDTHIAGNVTAGNAQRLFFSIPYDTGWKVKVDGKTAETTSVGEAFLSVKLSAGYHTITLDYTPNGFDEGWKISVLSWIMFLCICIMSPGYRKFREKKEAERLKRKHDKQLEMDTLSDEQLDEIFAKTEEAAAKEAAVHGNYLDEYDKSREKSRQQEKEADYTLVKEGFMEEIRQKIQEEIDEKYNQSEDCEDCENCEETDDVYTEAKDQRPGKNE